MQHNATSHTKVNLPREGPRITLFNAALLHRFISLV